MLRESVRIPALAPRTSRNIFTFLQNVALGEEGSAILEFVAIAIPLFIPLILYFGQLNGRVQENLSLHNLARQAARAYVTAPDEITAGQRAEAVISAAQARGEQRSARPSISISVECSAQPCLTPDARVKVTLHLDSSGLRASNIQVVNAWR